MLNVVCVVVLFPRSSGKLVCNERKFVFLQNITSTPEFYKKSMFTICVYFPSLIPFCFCVGQIQNLYQQALSI